jgi:hypothetical protein
MTGLQGSKYRHPGALIKQEKPEKKPPHRPWFVPSDAQRNTVVVMASNGNAKETIARALGISKNTLNRAFKNELQNGFEDVKSRVEATIVRMALNGSLGAAKFWLFRYCPEWRVARDNMADAAAEAAAQAVADAGGGNGGVRIYIPGNGRDKPDTDDDDGPIIEGEATSEAA